MKFARWILPFSLTLALYSFETGNGIEGNWTVKYVSGLAMKTVAGAEFTFRYPDTSSQEPLRRTEFEGRRVTAQ